jgi:CopG family nickel-responsive transcriptional regulator
MGTGLVRFGIAIDGDLLARFDSRIAGKGYATRSEAIRDLIRGDLVEEATGGPAEATGTLTLVYDHHVRELTERLTEMQHALGHHVVSTLHVHLDHDHCLEVVVMRGPGALLRAAADRIVATKGVIHGRLTLTGVSHLPGGHAHDHDHHERGARPKRAPSRTPGSQVVSKTGRRRK